LVTGEKFKIVESPPYIYFVISPDGKSIVYSSPEGGTGNRELNKIDIDGTNFVKIASNKSMGNFFPRWSPSSNFIAYERPLNMNHYGKAMSSEISLYDFTTKTETQVANEPRVLYNIMRWRKDDSIIIRSAKNGKRTYTSYRLEQ